MRHWSLVSVLSFLIAAAAAQVEAGGRGRASAKPAPRFGDGQLEAYWADQQIAYIRPGLKIVINSVTIDSDRKANVDFSLLDDAKQPLDREGNTTPGAISMHFVLSGYDPATRTYIPYVTADSGGRFTDLQTGHGTYTFGIALPPLFDVTKTYTVGVYATRMLSDLVGKDYVANAEFDFRPDSIAIKDNWDIIRESTSCNNCHDPLAAHGGERRDVKLCVLCHTPQATDSAGTSIDFRVMIHRIHRGTSLSKKPYVIADPQNTKFDFSNVVFPNDLRNCVLCHEGTDASNKPSQASVWFSFPSRATCGSCHDNVDFATGANHPGGKQADDNNCKGCHVPDSGKEYDASIKAAHTVPYKSKQLKGLIAQIISISNFVPGQKPTVVVDLKNGDGSAADAKGLTFTLMYAGTASDFRTNVRENASGAASDASGRRTYTFTTPLPADAGGTWAVTADVSRTIPLVRADKLPNIPVVESSNAVQYMTADKTAVMPRRIVVTTQQCNVCHDVLRAHDGQTTTTAECVICHNQTGNDAAGRPTSEGSPESISFQRMVHRIHRSTKLTQDYTLFDSAGGRHNFNSTPFSGDTRNCAKCHAAGTTVLPLIPALPPVVTLRDFYSPQATTAAACLGCHDTLEASAHAYINTTTFGGTRVAAESCSTCHGPGKDHDIAKAHAR